MKSRMMFRDEELKEFLDQKADQYNHPQFITGDPIAVPHKFSRKEDIELSAFLTATISWGIRSSIMRNANQLMNLMDNSPWQFITESGPKEINRCANFIHRTFNGSDCIFFIHSLKNIYQHHGGLESVFSEPIKRGKSIMESIINFREVFLELDHPQRVEKHIANPDRNASAKRINMFLRWMVRRDSRGVDFGLWKSISPSQLYCPLDIHTSNVSRKLGLLDRKANDWKSVETLTQKLIHFDSVDPIKYDFALFGLGIYEKF